MDRLHLPQIVKESTAAVGAAYNYEKSTTFSGNKKNGVASNNVNTAGVSSKRPRNSSKRCDSEQLEQTLTTSRKRSTDRQQRRMNAKKLALSGTKQAKGSPRFEYNSSKHNHERSSKRKTENAVGLPRININGSFGAASIAKNNNNINNLGFDGEKFDGVTTTTSKKSIRHRKSRRDTDSGDTISYVYSKSLQDQNCMAFIRNCMVGYEQHSKPITKQRSSGEHQQATMNTTTDVDRKPYGLPSLKASQGSGAEMWTSSTEECCGSIEAEDLSDGLAGIDNELYE